MFTGIVEPGEVVKVEPTPDGARLWISAPLLASCAIGASVATNGVCLTVTDRDGDTCCFDVIHESLERSTLGDLQPGDRVNVERPVHAGDELGGHVVQGHVDGVGTIVSRTSDDDGQRVRVDVGELTRYIVEKGSITVNGVSLTVTDVDETSFEVALIPHTLAVTNLGQAEKVNIEVDVLAKYVEKLTTRS
jgi:riboflavin synthase